MIITQPSTFCAYKPNQTAAISSLSVLSGTLLSSTDILYLKGAGPLLLSTTLD